MHAIRAHYQISLLRISIGEVQNCTRCPRLDSARHLAKVHTILKA
jgi:hypothetical protein